MKSSKNESHPCHCWCRCKVSVTGAEKCTDCEGEYHLTENGRFQFDIGHGHHVGGSGE